MDADGLIRSICFLSMLMRGVRSRALWFEARARVVREAEPQDRVILSSVTAAIFFLSGCGDQDGSSDSIGFSTPDALVEHVNELIAGNPYDRQGLMNLYFLENDLQARLFHIEEQAQPFLEFRHDIWVRYGEGVFDYEEEPPLATLQPASIVERGERRAVARTFDGLGNPLPIHLVEMDGTWYVSGHTLIHIFGGGDASEAEASADSYERYLADALPAAREFGPRVRAGEFATIEDLRLAMLMWER